MVGTSTLLITNQATLVVKEERKYSKVDAFVKASCQTNRHPFCRKSTKLLASAHSSAAALTVLAVIIECYL